MKRKMKKYEEEVEKGILWKDTKRYFGFPISFTKYSLDRERLYVDSGFLTSETNEVLLYRILDVKSSRSIWQRICGVGTVTLYNADKSDSVLELENIRRPHQIRRYISELVEMQRKANGITGKEIIGSVDAED